MKNAFLLLLALLAGCATVGSTVVENMTNIPSGKGVVIFSTGANRTNLSFSTGLSLVQAETRKKYDKVVINIDYPFASHFPTQHGHVRSLTLPEGDYFLIARSGNPYFCLTKYPTYQFTVKKGTISYLGSFQLSSDQIRLTTSNQQRDLQYFLQRNPAIQRNDISDQSVILDAKAFKSCSENSFVRGTLGEVP
jgi:hypothetical protein